MLVIALILCVIALNACKEDEPRQKEEFPSAPQNLRATVVGNSIHVEWDAVPGPTLYFVGRNGNGDVISYTTMSSMQTSSSYVDNHPLTGMNYYCVSANWKESGTDHYRGSSTVWTSCNYTPDNN